MARYERIKGMSVVSLQEGKKIGAVEELILDADQKQVRWLRLGSGSIFGGGDRYYVPVDAVRGVGDDAVTIVSEGAVRHAGDVPEAREMGEARRMVSGNKVVTEHGKFLGNVSDYEFAPDSFALTGLVLSEGSLLANRELTIPADRILTIGPDVLIVSDEAADYIATESRDMMPGVTPHVERALDDLHPREGENVHATDRPAGYRREADFFEGSDDDPHDRREGGAAVFGSEDR